MAKKTKKKETSLRLVLEGGVYLEEFKGETVLSKYPIDGKLVLDVLNLCIEEGLELRRASEK